VSQFILAKLMVVIALTWLLRHGAFAQDMTGLEIGDGASALASIGSELVAKQESGPFTIMKFRLPDGNDLSVTFARRTNRIVYLETAWNGQQSGTVSDFPNMIFGETSLTEIRQRFGQNGMAFEGAMGNVSDLGALINYNCYDIKRTKLVVCFVTELPPEKAQRLDVDPDSIDLGSATLGGLILSEASYLEALLGKNKLYERNYSAIEWR
jgi:hypothetical protein